jgi:hypothetical protein
MISEVDLLRFASISVIHTTMVGAANLLGTPIIPGGYES